MQYNSPYHGIDKNNAICLATNENPYGLPKDIQNELCKLLESTNRYPNVENALLKEKIANKYSVDPQNVLIGAGSDELLMLITIKHVYKGDNTIMSDPSFFRYKDLTELAGGKCKLVKGKNFHHDLDEIRKCIDDKTKIVFICNPNNPTGTMIRAEKIEMFINTLPKGILVVVDEAYFDFVYPKDSKSSIELINRFSNLIVLRSFSKFFALAALRIGYAIANKELISVINAIRSPYNVNSIAQAAAISVLDKPGFYDNTYLEVQQEKKYYYDFFSQSGIEYIPSQANFIFVDFGEKCEELCEDLKAFNIAVRPCRMFGYPNYARITIGSPEENKRVIASLASITSNNLGAEQTKWLS